MKSYRFFHIRELSCHCGRCDGEMDDIFMALIVKLRLHCNFPLHLSSAYRCESYNKLVGGSDKSPHLKGRAVDIIISGGQARILLGKLPKELTGVGANQTGVHEDRFIHLDNLSGSVDQPRPTFWTY